MVVQEKPSGTAERCHFNRVPICMTDSPSPSSPAASRRSNRLLITGLLLPCVLISLAAVPAFRAQHELDASVHWVEHTLEVERDLEKIRSIIVEAETGQRGFLLTGRANFLEPYNQAVTGLAAQLRDLEQLMKDNPKQSAHYGRLVPLVNAKLEFMAQTLSLQKAGDNESAMTMIHSGRGQEFMDSIRGVLAAMHQEEGALLVERQNRVKNQALFSTVMLTGLVVIGFAFALTIYVILRRLAKAQSMVTICAWSRTVEYEGEWLSFEEYLSRRFGLDASHGISPAEAEKAFGLMDGEPEKPQKKEPAGIA